MAFIPAGWESFTAVVLLILVALAMAGGILLLSHLVGPKRSGPTKSLTYESGMPVVRDARNKLSVHFYLVAILFLLFDVEIILLWLWAPLFRDLCGPGNSPAAMEMAALGYGRGFLAAEMAIFAAVLTAGLGYAWRKGVFRWN